ncbi:MAG: hypothetical protein AMJ81_00850 [Phycisphaerae bacterium SM23_33]|nr:MAG: hypothetical protein AMJ81_00850 [Phycisphaerae bacterium SM23_33]
MANEQHVVRSVSWNEVFSFTHVFKSFKMAIHPSKIVLAFLAIFLTYAWGRALDVVWTGVSDSNWVQKDEPWAYWTAESRAAFKLRKQEWLEQDRANSLRNLLREYPAAVPTPEKMAKADFWSNYKRLEEQYEKTYQEQLKRAEEAELDALKEAKDLPKEEWQAKKAQAHRDRLRAQRQELQNYAARCEGLRGVRGRRIFSAFGEWQTRCIGNAVGAVRRGNIATGLGKLYERRGSMIPAAYRVATVTSKTEFDASTDAPEGYGLLAWLAMSAWGLWWLVSSYPIYSLFLLPVALAIWAVLGGAICRIAALHAAREEKISIMAAVKFGLSKFLSFVSAPLLPLAIIVLLGLLVALGGAAGALPYFGEWFVALLFGLALMLAAVVTFLAIGLVAGWPLMWPTIAVEGSDSFDSISRSFSYVWARPFRYGLYWLVAGVYGTICYLFVRLFAFLLLGATHCWAGWAMRLADRPQYAEGAGKLDVMWARPTFECFHGPMQFEAMKNASEKAASVVLAFWVYVVSAVVLAFLVTFFFSAATNIYYLLRQKVDATDLDDVYVEEAEAEEAAAPPAEEQPEEQPPAEEKPAEEEGEEETSE